VDREPAPHRPPHAGGGAPREGRCGFRPKLITQFGPS
jgi:hypothetical protein